MKFQWKHLIFLLSIFVFLNTLNAQNLTVRVEPQSQNAGINQTISVNITIENASNLGGFQFDIFYNTEIVQAKTAAIGGLLGSTGRTAFPLGPDIDNNSNPAKITFGGATFGAGAGANGNGVLATIEFTTLTAGNSAIDLQNVQISDVNGQSLSVNSVNDGEVIVQGGNVNEIVVTNTNDAGEGSLRWALEQANSQAGPDTIIFNIPTTDPGYDPATGVWTIQPATGYLVPPGTTVDGVISTGSSDGSDTTRPGIEIDGTTLAAQGIIGLRLNDDVILRGLVINHFQYGIWVQSSNVIIEGCYIGSDPTGTEAKPNGADGILLANGAVNVVIQNNLLSGNNGGGVRLFGESTTGDTLRNNRIGTNVDGTVVMPNKVYGIRLHAGAHGNIIEGNLISANGGIGVHLHDAGTDSNVVRDNRIGTDAGGTEALPNASFGVAVFNGPQHNVIGPGNLVAHNDMDGVLVDGANSLSSTVGNTITANSITANGGRGIRNIRGGNLELAPPSNIQVNGSTVSGNAPPNAIVEIFSDDDDEGKIYEGTTTADANGNFQWNGTPTGPFVTATATDTDGNTSQFSQPEDITAVAETAESTIPQKFSLSQNYPNPFNPATTINFTVPGKFAGGVKVSFKIFNIEGQMMRSLVDEDKSPGFYSVMWDGKNEEGRKASSGLYFYTVSIGDFKATHKMILLQ